MARLVVAARALADAERLLNGLAETDPESAARAAAALRTALATLAAHPLAGDPLDGEIRGFRIAYGKIGAVAAYRYLIPADEIRVLALRPQRDLGIVP
jgi:plasmid stabilization system protein ParE